MERLRGWAERGTDRLRAWAESNGDWFFMALGFMAMIAWAVLLACIVAGGLLSAVTK